jgi:hypothetical protein
MLGQSFAMAHARVPLADLTPATPTMGLHAAPNYSYGTPPIPMSVGMPTVAVQHCFQAAQPWAVSPANMVSLQSTLAQEAAILEPWTALAVPPAASAGSAKSIAKAALKKPNAKKGTFERTYTELEFREMLDLVIRKEKSARKAAFEAGFPSATRSLQRFARGIRLKIKEASPEATVAAQRAHVAQLTLETKGNVDLVSRTLFSGDELQYFARALKLYADLGWPMDYDAIRQMFSEAAAESGRVDWKRGDAYVCGETYVRDFVKSRPELKASKAGHVDPLRAKKATSQVCICVQGVPWDRDCCTHDSALRPPLGVGSIFSDSKPTLGKSIFR